MESNLDQKQLLVLGYLRKLLFDSQLRFYQLGINDNDDIISPIISPKASPKISPASSPLSSPILNGISSSSSPMMLQHGLSSPSLSGTIMTKYDEHLQLFNLGIPQLKGRSYSMESVASDLSDHELILSSINYQLPVSIITLCYMYYHRYQSFLLLLGGSEECKDLSYNQIQIINLRTINDIKQENDYPYTNYRLKPYLWREKINYNKYFNKSINKYLKQSKTVNTPEPISVIPGAGAGNNNNKDKPIGIKVESPWSAMNSPHSPFADVAATVDDNNNNDKTNTLSPFHKMSIAEMNHKAKPRSKSSSNLAKLQKKEIKKKNTATKINNNNNKNKNKKVKAISMKKRKSACGLPPGSTSLVSSSSSENNKNKKNKNKKLKSKTGTKLMKRHSTMLPISKKNKTLKNAVLHNVDFDRYSHGEYILSVDSDNCLKWPWLQLKSKYDNNGNKKKRDNLEFKRYKMYIRCGGISTKDDDYLSENDLILFNAINLNDIGRQIDSYFCKLPAFKQRLESPSITFACNNNLLSFGGYSYDDGKCLNKIYSLNLNTKRNKFKWKKYNVTMNKSRYDSSIVHIINDIGQNKFIVIGGKGNNSKPLNDVELFDSSKTTKSSKFIQLKELNFPRFKPGVCRLNNDNNKIACCGGILYGKGANNVEIYDFHKNKWLIHSAKLQNEHQHPSIWCETKQINPNILYVAGNNITFGAKKGSLGYIEWTDLRTKDKKFNLLYPDPIEELYEFWAIRPNLWEPRSLLHFSL